MSPAPPLLRRHLTKMFSSYDSLKFELARLETFIGWPLPWLSPADLAANGFYFLRKDDHCACAFCLLIVGEWEENDTPNGEHSRHMSECPFINGRAVGNVPMNQCDILDKLPTPGEDYPCAQPRRLIGNDDNGDDDDNLLHLGLYRFKWAVRNEYITYEQRMNSFRTWPIRSPNQTPKRMVEAGFYYTNLSDHVKCFHCGGGLRNWRHEDQPFDEHARWYPRCVFVILMKGQKFIDRVKPNVVPSSGRFEPLSDSDLDEMMKSDVVLAVIKHGFPSVRVRKVLWQKIKDTGIPFFSTIECVDKLLENMSEDEKKLEGVKIEEVEPEFDITEFEQLRVIDYEKQSERLPPPESRVYSDDVEVDDRLACKICMKVESEIAFLPCNHVSTCSSCTSVIKWCPICRSNIRYFHRAIL